MSKVNKLSDQQQSGSLKKMLKNPFARVSPPRQTVTEPSIPAISSTLESATTSVAEDVAATTEDKEVDRRKKKKVVPPPPGTYEYVVKEGDKLRSLAAQFDTTPSVLKKLNKLTMDFLYPDQVLRIPDADYAALNSPATNDKTASDLPCKSTKDEASHKKAPMVFPGHIVRSESSCHSIVDELDLPPRPLGRDEAEFLDKECFQRFIKIDSMYITEHNGPVDGVLLVTPNAVMFDPNVSNPVVMEKGADEFGMIAKMDTVMSASIYHDMEAMQCLNNRKSDPTVTKPPVYHSTSPVPDTVSAMDQKGTQSLSNEEDTNVGQSSSNTSDSMAASNADLAADKNSNATSSQNNANSDSGDTTSADSDSSNTQSKQLASETSSSTMADTLLLTPSSLTMSTANNSTPLANVLDNTGELSLLDTEVKSSENEAGEEPESANTDIVPEGPAVELQRQTSVELSLYLCLRVGQPINKTVSTTCPIESYSKKKRPEYWFSVPREKVDLLYAFFVQWKPEVYDPDDIHIDNGGFVAITEDGNPIGNENGNTHTIDPEHLATHLGHQVSLDWEIVSWDEVRRRRTIDDFEKYVQLPELKAESQIITESHIKQLARCLPARIEGCPWGLAFGSEQHGYSLNQMYRNMQGLDCPVLLVILTTDDQIFGALSSCPFHMSELFYGTGESFLFTFVDGFKTYPWTGTNSFFNKGDQTCLSIGSGEGSFGIWVDGDMYLGRTQNCQTYANDPLTGEKEDFHIKQLEIWSFHDDE